MIFFCARRLRQATVQTVFPSQLSGPLQAESPNRFDSKPFEPTLTLDESRGHFAIG